MSESGHEWEELELFCREHYPRLVRTLSLYVGSRDVAQELTQETLARVCRHWRRVRAADNSEAWVHKVAINLANSNFRRRAAEARRGLERLRLRSSLRDLEEAPDVRSH